MARRIIDLSIPLNNDVITDPPDFRPDIDYRDHQGNAPELLQFFPGLTAGDLPNGEGWANEKITLSTHSGTHLDAPYHHASTMNRGEKAITIDKVPLDWCFAPGVKLDFRGFEDGYVATAADVEAELARIGHELKPLDIVVVNTRAGSRFGEDDYLTAGCGMGRDATLFLLHRGVRVTGIDGWSWDAPFVHTKARYEKDRDATKIWEGHRASLEIGYSHIEKLSNLEALPSTGFMIACFPINIRAASAGWTRAVAILDT